jgi:hypothetical protein
VLVVRQLIPSHQHWMHFGFHFKPPLPS